MTINKVYNGDCLELMKDIPNGTVDMILCDLPYGTTKNKWDTVIPFNDLWEHYERVIKPNGAIALTGKGIFTAKLIVSKEKLYRYSMVWEKTRGSGFLNANRMPMQKHEDICIFYKKLPVYNPQYLKGDPYVKKRGNCETSSNYGDFTEPKIRRNIDGKRHPGTVVKISDFNGAVFGYTSNRNVHPTQKPVPLFEYLIRTYTNEGDTVLDNCAGSGTTAIACVNTNRNYICMERDEVYYDGILKRINQHTSQQSIFGIGD